MIEETASIAGDHPALAGHFPGRPVVPAALLLDVVIRTAEANAQWRIAEVMRMKFHRPLMPETEFSIRLRPIAGGRVEVSCHVGEDPLISGLLRIGAGESRS
ncbi:MAG: hypothetical protein OEQ29_01565 [Alphaproteobacteria bacterium]|nr:hypothetical protein [Alphaproteobacteria bacterium]